MSGWRLRFGVGAGAVGVVADVSLSVGWLSVDCGVGGLCTGGLGLRSRWKLRTNGETERCFAGERHAACVCAGEGGAGRLLPAGARGALPRGEEEPGGADLLELGLFAGVQEDHG